MPTPWIPSSRFSFVHVAQYLRPSMSCAGYVSMSCPIPEKSKLNLRHNISKALLPTSASARIEFLQADVMAEEGLWKETRCDVIVSNPPYVLPTDYDHITTRSVRNHEPKKALVPEVECATDEAVGDAFYPHIISLAEGMSAKLVVMEVGDIQQAKRVVDTVGKSKVWGRMEIWRDGIADSGHPKTTTEQIGEHLPTVRGTGEGRAVVFWRDTGTATLNNS
ncbi:MAG: hypothetical protein Q9171_003757 [Xanthocarpia ochracea]